jgi:hypothetical protein
MRRLRLNEIRGVRPEVCLSDPYLRGQGFAAVNPGFTNV